MTDLEIPVLGERQKSALSMAGVFLGLDKLDIVHPEGRKVEKCWDDNDAEERVRFTHKTRQSAIPKKIQKKIRMEHSMGMKHRKLWEKHSMRAIGKRYGIPMTTVWEICNPNLRAPKR